LTETGLWLTSAEWQAVRLSLLVSLVAVAASLPLGIACGFFLARRQFPGKALVETLINLPLVVPPVVTGYLLLVLFGSRGPLGRLLEQTLGWRVIFTWKAAALAAAVVAFPLMVRSIRLAFTTVDTKLEQTARTLGAGPLDTFFTVSLPLARHGVIAGAVLAFARSLGEFGATIMVAGSIPGATRTIPLEIFQALQTPGGVERAARIVVVSILLAGLALIVSEFLERRGRNGGQAE
jgi:molybdate transport system permease protein